MECEIADGTTVENMGERSRLMKTSELVFSGKDGLEMQLQVVDVSKALMSVHCVCEQGHGVLCSNSDQGSSILIGGSLRNKIPLRHVGGIYEVNPDLIRQR